GAALCFLIWTLLAARVDHVAVLGRVEAARAAPAPDLVAAPAAAGTGRLAGLRLRAGVRVSGMLTSRGVRATTLHQDLALIDRGVNDFLGATVLVAAATMVGALLSGTLLISVDMPMPPVALLPAAVLLAGLMVFARIHDVHRLAEQRRRE